MPNWTRGTEYSPYQSSRVVEIVSLSDTEPTRRDAGVISFKKYKMCPVLFAFQLPECALPPVVVEFMSASQAFRYRIVNGFHRFYASVHVGYTHIPVDIWGAWTSDRLFLEISIPEPSLIYLGLLFKSTKPLLYSN